MKHIKQAKNECFPTTLAMLTGVDINKILADSAAISPIAHSWADYQVSGDESDVIAVYRALARKYYPALIEHVGIVNSAEIAKASRFMSYPEYARKTASGKGAVLLASRFLSRPQAHICAYESGMIYCSDQDGPMPARDYYVLLATKTVLCPYAVISEGDL